MTHETTTSLRPDAVLERAQRFFTERVPNVSAFPEESGSAFATFRGQGGEELTVAVFPHGSATRVRASTLFFDQAIGRFFSTLPPSEEDTA